MRYDIKVFERNEEMETIRDLTHTQMIVIRKIFDRCGIKYSIKEVD